MREQARPPPLVQTQPQTSALPDSVIHTVDVNVDDVIVNVAEVTVAGS